MSASLVGSEMCIRDRGPPLRSSVELSGPVRGSVTQCGSHHKLAWALAIACLLYTSDAADDM
eukprot:438352-Alexandrium_andersonii.AAC.1